MTCYNHFITVPIAEQNILKLTGDNLAESDRVINRAFIAVKKKFKDRVAATHCINCINSNTNNKRC